MRSEQRFADERQSPITVVVVDDKHLIRSALVPCNWAVALRLVPRLPA